MGLMNLFGLFGKKPVTTPTRQQERAKERQEQAQTEATTTLPSGQVQRVAVNPARRMQRLSCRGRKLGHENAAGQWMSRFDIHLLYKRGMALSKIREVFGHQAMRWAVTGR